jgi:hypothetical protein
MPGRLGPDRTLVHDQACRLHTGGEPGNDGTPARSGERAGAVTPRARGADYGLPSPPCFTFDASGSAASAPSPAVSSRAGVSGVSTGASTASMAFRFA